VTAVVVEDECLWLKHVPESALKSALASIYPECCIELLVDGAEVTFERMRQGANPSPTTGFRPVGRNKEIWREAYLGAKGQAVEIEFAGKINV
jgi:hypothetical protein